MGLLGSPPTRLKVSSAGRAACEGEGSAALPWGCQACDGLVSDLQTADGVLLHTHACLGQLSGCGAAGLAEGVLCW